METTKISLAKIQGKLSRSEMKNIMAGSGGGCANPQQTISCSVYSNGGTYSGSCGYYNWSVGTCKCGTSLGNYTTASGTYGCGAFV